MPLIQIKGVDGFLSLERKQDFVRRVADAVASDESEGLCPVTWVLVEDDSEGCRGAGGKPATSQPLGDVVDGAAASR